MLKVDFSNNITLSANSMYKKYNVYMPAEYTTGKGFLQFQQNIPKSVYHSEAKMTFPPTSDLMPSLANLMFARASFV